MSPLRLSEEDDAGDRSLAPADTPDLLVKDYIYTQTFTVAEEGWRDFETLLEDYISYMLEDAGLIFYKATWFCGLEALQTTAGSSPSQVTSRLYTVHFFLFSHRIFTEVPEGQASSRRAEIEAPDFLRAHLSSKFPYDEAHFHTTLVAEQSTFTRSRTFK